MLLSSILSACSKNGVTVTPPTPGRQNSYILTKGENVLTFHAQDDYVGYMTWHSPQTDVMTDCFCDSYYKTIKDAMHFLNPSGEMVQPSRSTNITTVKDDDIDAGIVVTRNMEKGGIEIRFPSKPSNSVITSLKDKGFRWSPYNSVWWKKYSLEDYGWALDTFTTEETNSDPADITNQLEAMHS